MVDGTGFAGVMSDSSGLRPVKFECTTRSNLRQARCRDFGNCVAGKITGFTYDGGYVEYMVVPVEAVASMPRSLGGGCAAALCRDHDV